MGMSSKRLYLLNYIRGRAAEYAFSGSSLGTSQELSYKLLGIVLNLFSEPSE